MVVKLQCEKQFVMVVMEHCKLGRPILSRLFPDLLAAR